MIFKEEIEDSAREGVDLTGTIDFAEFCAIINHDHQAAVPRVPDDSARLPMLRAMSLGLNDSQLHQIIAAFDLFDTDNSGQRMLCERMLCERGGMGVVQ